MEWNGELLITARKEKRTSELKEKESNYVVIGVREDDGVI